MDSYLDRALKDGKAALVGDGKGQQIVYLASGDHTERYSDPEEQVRAEFWAELIYRYQYDPVRMRLEVVVPDRQPYDKADIVIFEDDARKRPYAVIECKRDGITDNEFNQAVEQAYGIGNAHKFRAKYAMVVAGLTRRVLDLSDVYGAMERELNVVADLPTAYGKPQEFKFTKDGSLDIRPVDQRTLINTIKKCHQTLWGGGRLSPPVAFGELCKLIFVKVRDEMKPRRKGDPYDFQIKTHERAEGLAQRIRALYDDARKHEAGVFDDPLKVTDATLSLLVSHLESINLNKTDLDAKGVAFERFMDGFFKGQFGQYFTPRPVIAFIVQMMDLTHTDLVLDPACGSGGFLLHALDAVRREASEYYTDGTPEHFRHWHDFAEKNLYGIEINDEIARVAKMNMILHDDGHTNVGHADALQAFDALRRETANPGCAEGRFTKVITNPPFGATVLASERPYLGEYMLGNVTDSKGRSKVRKQQKTEILYFERIRDFLKPGTGRAAVVVPDGVLTNSSLAYVRAFVMEHFRLDAVVSLPGFAFAHYGAGVKSSVLFLTRRAENETPKDDEATFMAVAEHVGYDATGRADTSDLDEILADYRRFQADPSPFFV